MLLYEVGAGSGLPFVGDASSYHRSKSEVNHLLGFMPIRQIDRTSPVRSIFVFPGLTRSGPSGSNPRMNAVTSIWAFAKSSAWPPRSSSPRISPINRVAVHSASNWLSSVLNRTSIILGRW
jgi:hypothetical protein